MNIFQAKTEEQIKANYQKLSCLYGKWNAETYLKILKALNAEDKEAKIPPVDRLCPLPQLGKIKCGDIKCTSRSHKQDRFGRLKHEVSKDCNLDEKDKRKSHVPQDFSIPEKPESSYKKIFKNAKLKRTPIGDQKYATDVLTLPPPREKEKQTAAQEETCKVSATLREPCELVQDGPNNYLLKVRKKGTEKKMKKVSFGSTSEVHLDEVERYYQNRSMQTVLKNYLEEHIQLLRASLKAHVPDDAMMDLARETGFSELKARCLNDTANITEFQNMFDDAKWRKKFQLEKIEESDEDDSLDVSDIASSETDSMCSGDSLDSELDYKPKPLPPSRIPGINEVHVMSDILFDKIALKWEKAVKKNFIDANTNPVFRHFCNAVRLRSTIPVYSDIMKMLEPYDDVYSKKYTPHKYRMKDRLKKIAAMEEAKDAVVWQRREVESCQIRRHYGEKSESPVTYLGMDQPAKYQGKNQRHRMERIIWETKFRDREGLADFRRKAVLEDYVNLKPMIQTKKRKKKTDGRYTHGSIATHLSNPDGSKRSAQTSTPSMRSILGFETSLFFEPRKPKTQRLPASIDPAPRSKLLSNSTLMSKSSLIRNRKLISNSKITSNSDLIGRTRSKLRLTI